MPVQINELIIRANIVEPAVNTANAVNGSSTGKDEIIKECTEIILDILKTNAER
jgi:phenylpyruvate tautomerase PptA (4-oxalocrotonate tautomerase family)